MDFIKVDTENWNRKEHYEYFSSFANCSFNITDNIDITDLIIFSKYHQIEFYPIYLYLISKSVNEIKELRMTLVDGDLGYHLLSHPSYTVFNKEEQIFYNLVTEYHPDFKVFLENYSTDNDLHHNSLTLFPQDNRLENIINISSIPWVNFSAFEINLKYDDYLLPIITNGKYVKENDIFIMPLSIRVNHCVTDGFHVGLFFKKFRENIEVFIQNSIV